MWRLPAILTNVFWLAVFIGFLIALVLLLDDPQPTPASGWCVGNESDWQMGAAPENVPCDEL